jgi:hypothetical protein
MERPAFHPTPEGVSAAHPAAVHRPMERPAFHLTPEGVSAAHPAAVHRPMERPAFRAASADRAAGRHAEDRP